MESLSVLSAFGTPAAEHSPAIAALMLIWGGLFGGLVGSFLNVVIARVPQGLSVVTPRSRCPRCESEIAWYDNIPVLSWILLRARCRQCKLPISMRYPLVELLVAGIGMGVAARYGFSPAGFELFTFATILVAVAFIDLDTWTIPLVLPGILVLMGLGMAAAGTAMDAQWALPAWLWPALDPSANAFSERGIGAIAGFASFALLNVAATGLFRRTGRLPEDGWAMGWGDPVLLAGIGAVLGWRSLPLVVAVGSLQGAVVGIALRIAGRAPATVERERVEARQAARADEASDGADGGVDAVPEEDDWIPPESSMPYGPFLALGGLEVAFFGGAIAIWMSRLTALLGGGG